MFLGLFGHCEDKLLKIVGMEFRMPDDRICDFWKKCVELAAKLSERMRQVTPGCKVAKKI